MQYRVGQEDRVLESGEIVPGLLPTQTSPALLGSLALPWEDEWLKAIAMV